MGEFASPRSVEARSNGLAQSTAIKVEKGVPIPGGVSPGRPTKYPWSEMEVGDSFAVPLRSEKAMSVVSTAASKWGKRNNCRFAIRTITENGVRVARVWRVA